MAKNQLPEGVGKKIVEALKRQAEADITPIQSIDSNINENDVTDADFDALQEVSSQKNNENVIVEEENSVSETFNINIDENTNSEESTFDISKMQEETFTPIVNENVSDTKFDVQNMKEENLTETTFDIQSMNDSVLNKATEETEPTLEHPLKEPIPETPLFKSGNEAALSFKPQSGMAISSFNTNMPLSEEPKKSVVSTTVSIRIPTNVAVLRNLISSLPVGVTKQTGAQIIRQTLEAMGLPMAGVLKEAQEVQEELNTNTRECMLKIQEYKTNIMQLEQSVQEYQKNVTQINDLVSLFLLTDRK